MSGHSKWAQIKRQKGVADARRGQVFTRLGREITVAVRQGGGDPSANFRLRLAIQRARDANMPAENVERAIKRGTGETGAAELAEIIFEGYGPGGSAILVQTLTDNRNRTVSEVRHAFTRAGSNLGEAGCVAWLFEQKGVLVVPADGSDPEQLALVAIDSGAEDVKVEGDVVEVQTQPHDLETVQRALEEKGLTVSTAEVSLVPKSLVPLEEKDALQALKLLERLEELDDVQHVFTNADFPNYVLEQVGG